MFSLHVKSRKQLQTEPGSVSGPVLFTSYKMVYRIPKMVKQKNVTMDVYYIFNNKDTL